MMYIVDVEWEPNMEPGQRPFVTVWPCPEHVARQYQEVHTILFKRLICRSRDDAVSHAEHYCPGGWRDIEDEQDA
jgi:hypothetical protein